MAAVLSNTNGRSTTKQPTALRVEKYAVSIYEPWGWVLVTPMFNDELQSALSAETQAHKQTAMQRRLQLLLLLGAVLLLG